MKNLVGNTYGSLIATERLTIKRRAYYVCLCVCGNKTTIEGNKLSSSLTKSCGCSRRKSYQARGLKTKLELGLANARKVIHYYKRNAKRRNIEFELTEEQCLTLFKQDCHYCKTPPFNILSTKNPGDFTYNGIDRKDNSIHYTIDNCVPCCKYCNFMKNNLTLEVFIAQVSKIYHTLNLCPILFSNK